MRSSWLVLVSLLAAASCTDANGVPRCSSTPEGQELKPFLGLTAPSRGWLDMIFLHGGWDQADQRPTKSHDSARVEFANLAEFPALAKRTELTRFTLEINKADIEFDPSSYGKKRTYHARILSICAP